MSKNTGEMTRSSSLKFKLKLVATSKPLSTSELLKRLKSLFGELSTMEQEEVDQNSLKSITHDLINKSLMGHKDNGIKAYVACCISDLLRLYAPDAPYTDHELREIFVFFVQQLQNIGKIDGPYFDLYFHLLENLSTVKIVLLILELQDYEEILIELFRNFFDVVRPELSNIVYSHMVDILEQLINDGNALPQDVIDIILAQFLRKRKDENPTAYRLACDVCRAATDKLQRYVCQYFTDVIVAAEKTGTSADELNDFKTAHDLIKELNRVAPGLLLNVIPQLEEELKLDDLNLRMLATQVLGEMFSEKDSTLASRYDSVWRTWLLRRNDKVADVRCTWVEFCLPLYTNHHELADQINEAIITKLSDPDDKVRIAVCRVFCQLEYECASKHVKKDLFIELAKRCRDRKHGVRQEAIKALARLYNMAYLEILDNEANAPEKFGWIPSELLNTIYTNDNEIIASVENVLHEEILASNNVESTRMDRLLVVFGSLEAKAKKAFFSILQRQKETINDMEIYLNLCENSMDVEVDGDADKADDMLNQTINRIAGKLPDPLKSVNHLSSFPKLNNSRIYKLIRGCMNPTSDYKTVKKSAKDALKCIEQLSPSSAETFSTLIRRISLTIINRDLIALLLDKIRSMDTSKHNGDSIIAHELFRETSHRFPAIFKPYFHELTDLAINEDDETTEDSLEVLSKLAKTFPDETPQERGHIERFMKLSLEGTPKQAKFATIILGHVRQKDQLCTLSQCVLYAPIVYEEKSDSITNFIVKEILMKNYHKAVPGDDVEWVEDHVIDDECKAKIMGLKVLVNRLLTVSDREVAVELAKPIFKLFWNLIREGGELLAVHNLLKLAHKKIYNSMISVGEFQELAFMIQDPCYQVRFGFASRLVKYCASYLLHARFLSIFFLTAHDPAHEIRDMVKVFLTRQSRATGSIRDKNLLFEMSLVRLIHLLSHHPDFSHELNVLSEFIVYIDFFLNTIADSENISYLFCLAGKLKQVRDKQSLEQSENLYLLSDLTQHLIRAKCKSFSWPLTDFPGDVNLPNDLFSKLSNPEIISQITTKNYIPNEFMKTFEKKHGSTHNKNDKALNLPTLIDHI
ncbi:23507_t:CDS:10 [Entrophospora sp. SA101]|nr:23507_t:CDS:10 [Entrophospora sp. SA101]